MIFEEAAALSNERFRNLPPFVTNPIQVEFPDGIVVHGTTPQVLRNINLTQIPLVFTEPPYTCAASLRYDRQNETTYAQFLVKTMRWLQPLVRLGAAAYVIGGIGSYLQRQFLEFLLAAEIESDWVMSNLLTWTKRIAVGTQTNYMFTRLEIAYFIYNTSRPSQFVIPYTSENNPRARPGTPPFYRRSNVWTDIPELIVGKLHKEEKPTKLAEIAIETHTSPLDYVLDPFAGSGSTAVAARNFHRKFILIEDDRATFETIVNRLTTAEYQPSAPRALDPVPISAAAQETLELLDMECECEAHTTDPFRI